MAEAQIAAAINQGGKAKVPSKEIQTALVDLLKRVCDLSYRVFAELSNSSSLTKPKRGLVSLFGDPKMVQTRECIIL